MLSFRCFLLGHERGGHVVPCGRVAEGGADVLSPQDDVLLLRELAEKYPISSSGDTQEVAPVHMGTLCKGFGQK